MKKLETYTQQHHFYDKLKELLTKLDVVVAYTKTPDDSFAAFTVTHILPNTPEGIMTEGYAELCRASLELNHVTEVAMDITARLPTKVGEVSLETFSYWQEESSQWLLESKVYTRSFMSPVVLME
jgi:hypothetical protein